MQYDIKPIIDQYIPSLINLLGENKISWRSVNKKFSKFIERINNNDENGNHQIDANLYVLLKNKADKIAKSDAMLDFYSYIFENLYSYLSNKERKLIGKTILNILTEMQKDYMHYIGELAVLDFYKREYGFKLLSVEDRIYKNSNVHLDFLFEIGKENTLHVEVVNLHAEIKDFRSKDELKHWLENKLKKKKNEKILEQKKKILIQPVVWTKDLFQLKLLEELYDQKLVSIEKVQIPFGYLTYYLKDVHKYEHRFEPVNMILKEE